MHRITNFTGQARHGWDRMTPAAFGMSRPHAGSTSQQLRRPQGSSTAAVGPSAGPGGPQSPGDGTVNLSFNVPFASNLSGPLLEEILHSSPNALQRWTSPVVSGDKTATHKLPVHANNVEALRNLCRHVSEQSGGRIEATVTSSELKSTPTIQRRHTGLVTNVCISGDGELVPKIRAKILNETPISLVRP